MLSLDEILDLGVLVTEEQIDFLHHPESRFAVAVYGVPDPDRLYISGPDRSGTVYQMAPEGEPADDHGMQACLLPIVFIGGDQKELARYLEDWMGDSEESFPAVHGWPQNAEFSWSWTTDEIPITVACWDLWPIAGDEVSLWIDAANKAYGNSALPAMFELIENYNGGEYYGPRHEEMQDELYRLESKYRFLGNEAEQEEQALKLASEAKDLQQNMDDVAADYLAMLEKEIIHPTRGEIDAQLPPVGLEPEQAAIWHSLQALSWRNWSLLNKNSGHDGDALYGGRFAEANRRLCPWY